MSIAASIPTAGVKGQANAAFMRAAAGNAEALERAPLVVGFADRRAPIERLVLSPCDPLYLSDIQAPQAGWVFGPPVRINAKTNKLELIQSTV